MSTMITWSMQSSHFSKNTTPSEGFFYKCLRNALLAEVVTLLTVIVLGVTLGPDIIWTFEVSPVKMGFLTFFLCLAFGSLLFTAGVTNIVTSTVMSSYKSPLRTPFARSTAYVADGVGTVLGLILIVLADLAGAHTIVSLVAPLIFTCTVHVSIALINYWKSDANPGTAGSRVQLHTLTW